MAGFEVVREDDPGTLRLVLLLFFCSAVGVDVWTSVWLTARECLDEGFSQTLKTEDILLINCSWKHNDST